MTEEFADSFYYFALLNPTDAAHELAVSCATSLVAPLVTTAWVLTELADGMANKSDRAECIAFIDELRRSPKVIIVPSTPELFERGLGLYRNRPDKDWSLTDCISFVVMQREGISEALTADHHFEQAGFAALLK